MRLFLGIGLLHLIAFNAVAYGCRALFGAAEVIPGLLSLPDALATAFILVDVAVLPRVLSPQTHWRQEPAIVKVLFVAWGMTVLFGGFVFSMGLSEIVQVPAENAVFSADMFGVIVQIVVIGVSVVVTGLRLLMSIYIVRVVDVSLTRAAPQVALRVVSSLPARQLQPPALPTDLIGTIVDGKES